MEFDEAMLVTWFAVVVIEDDGDVEQDVVPGDPVAVVVGTVSDDTEGVRMVLGSAGTGGAGGVKVVMCVDGEDDSGVAELVLSADGAGNGQVVGDPFVGDGAGVSVFATVFVTVMGETGLGFTVEITFVLVVVFVAGDAVTTTVSVTGGDNEVTVSTTVVAVGPSSPPPSIGTTEYVAFLGAMKPGDGFSHWRKGSAAHGTHSSDEVESSSKLGFMAAAYMGRVLRIGNYRRRRDGVAAESLGKGQNRAAVSEGLHLKRGVGGAPRHFDDARRNSEGWTSHTQGRNLQQWRLSRKRGGVGNRAPRYTGGWCCRRAVQKAMKPP